MRILTNSVVVQLIVGALIKTFVPGANAIESWLTWTTFSVIGLFMMVGLEIHPKKFAKDFGLCTMLVVITTTIPFAIFYLIGTAFGLGRVESLTMSVVLVTTGTGVTIQTLANLGKLHTKVGQFLTLVSALDDVPAAIVMAMLLANAPVVADSAWIVDWTSVVISVLFIGAVYLLLQKDFKHKNVLISVLVFGFGIFFSRVLEKFHVSSVMGGLISGILMSLAFGKKLDQTEEILQKLLKPILILYMIFIGMKLSPSVLKDKDAMILSVVLVVVATFSKWFSTYLIMRKREDLSPKTMAWGMVPRGIPGFAFASAAVTSGLITKDLFTILILIVSVTTWIGLAGLEYNLRNEK